MSCQAYNLAQHLAGRWAWQVSWLLLLLNQLCPRRSPSCECVDCSSAASGAAHGLCGCEDRGGDRKGYGWGLGDQVWGCGMVGLLLCTCCVFMCVHTLYRVYELLAVSVNAFAGVLKASTPSVCCSAPSAFERVGQPPGPPTTVHTWLMRGSFVYLLWHRQRQKRAWRVTT